MLVTQLCSVVFYFILILFYPIEFFKIFICNYFQTLCYLLGLLDQSTTMWLNEQKFIASQFERLEVQGQGARKVGSFRGARSMPFSSLGCFVDNLWSSLACRSIVHLCLPLSIVFSLCMSVSKLPLFQSDISHIGLGAHSAPV